MSASHKRERERRKTERKRKELSNFDIRNCVCVCVCRIDTCVSIKGGRAGGRGQREKRRRNYGWLCQQTKPPGLFVLSPPLPLSLHSPPFPLWPNTLVFSFSLLLDSLYPLLPYLHLSLFLSLSALPSHRVSTCSQDSPFCPWLAKFFCVCQCFSLCGLLCLTATIHKAYLKLALSSCIRTFCTVAMGMSNFGGEKGGWITGSLWEGLWLE